MDREAVGPCSVIRVASAALRPKALAYSGLGVRPASVPAQAAKRSVLSRGSRCAQSRSGVMLGTPAYFPMQPGAGDGPVPFDGGS
jgi:hypothetical protein